MSSIISNNNDRPKRPLCAYNFFFREQRRQLLLAKKQQQPAHSQPRKSRRRGEGRVGFSELGKTVARRWKLISPEEKKKYQELAKQEKERYDKAMEEWKKRQEDTKTSNRKETISILIDEEAESYVHIETVEGTASSRTTTGNQENKDDQATATIITTAQYLDGFSGDKNTGLTEIKVSRKNMRLPDAPLFSLNPLKHPSCLDLESFDQDWTDDAFEPFPVSDISQSRMEDDLFPASSSTSEQNTLPKNAMYFDEHDATHSFLPNGSMTMVHTQHFPSNYDSGFLLSVDHRQQQQQYKCYITENNSDSAKKFAQLAGKLGPDGVDYFVDLFG